MSPFRIVMAILCVLGVVLPMRYFLPWLAENDWSLAAMLDAWHVSDATSGLVWDLTVAAITLTVWIAWECITRRNWVGLIAIPATYMVGVSLGLPLYLLLRLP
ncbi:hypothetical protein JANAI62_04470 [Jannaschia pagri]|uniref:K+-transporting ATPase, A chain n=1 Tax=Jannaschia pagri TaxID=2829797 RepID=A0ABQ4NI10_9RHOB|nr:MULTISPECIES: DUF2834 domain-containing protein [unclassified Jannaschia]GIT90070.1 hypothetical protein JANAI61_05280 [Jannaschia sp. AI_61]GIT93824.1 hypothetical protein JANAI62_04470 [Jannaschia sp. AI_62]